MGQVKRYDTDISHLRPINQIPENYKMDALVFPDKGRLGHSVNDNGIVDKSPYSNTVVVNRIGISIYSVIVKRITAMAETKVVMWIANILGIPAYLLSAWLNFGEFKGHLLFAIGFIYSCAKVYFYIEEQRDRRKNRKLNLKVKEHDVEEELADDNDN